MFQRYFDDILCMSVFRRYYEEWHRCATVTHPPVVYVGTLVVHQSVVDIYCGGANQTE
jgi:hypothetical protein